MNKRVVCKQSSGSCNSLTWTRLREPRTGPWFVKYLWFYIFLGDTIPVKIKLNISISGIFNICESEYSKKVGNPRVADRTFALYHPVIIIIITMIIIHQCQCFNPVITQHKLSLWINWVAIRNWKSDTIWFDGLPGIMLVEGWHAA